MRRVIEWRCGAYGRDALHAFVTVWVELSHRRRELGVFDVQRIAETATLFHLDEADISPVWHEAKNRTEEAYTMARRSAERALDRHTDSVTVGRRRLISGIEVSTAFAVTDHVKRNAFGARLVTLDDGGTIKTPRLRTRLPTIGNDGDAEVRPQHSRVETVTRAQRLEIARRFGWQIDTVSAAARTKTPDEFRTWVAERESETWSVERLEGRKEPGESDWHATQRLKASMPKTRKRDRGVTAARRDLAAVTGEGERTIRTKTAGWTVTQIDSEAARLSRLPQYGCHVCPDKNRQNRPFAHKSIQIDVSKTPDESRRDTHLPSARTAAHEKQIPAHVRAHMAEWYREKHGKELKSATVRKWRQRERLDAIVLAVCEWMQAREWAMMEDTHDAQDTRISVGLVRPADDYHPGGF